MVAEEYLSEDSPPLSWANENYALTNYSFLLPFENWPYRYSYAHWQYDHWDISLWGFCIYIFLVHALQKVMANRKAFDLRTCCVVWNTGAAIFSVIGFYRSSQEVLRVMWRHGFEHSVCVSSYVQDAVFCFWIKAFLFSKFFEFIDTAFLILRKRPVTFLHWYHHATVLVFCWHGGRTLTAAGRWFCVMNYGVHMVIYTYFALRTYGFGCPKWVSMCVTVVQMSQMVAGCLIGYTVYKVKSLGQPCHQSWTNLYMAFAIYSTFLFLFAHYFYRTYIRNLHPKRGRAKMESIDENQNLASKADHECLRNRLANRSAFSEAG